MDLTIVIPAYNEAGRIGSTLETIAEYFSGRDRAWEIVLVDDGSEDETAALVEGWAGSKGAALDGRVRVVRIAHQGKGAAVAEGVAQARGRWLLMTDADLSTPIAEWERVERELSDGAQVVAGSRQIAGARIEVHQPWLRQRLGLLFGGLVRTLFPVGVIDSQCGFKGFETAAAQSLFADLSTKGLCFDVEVLLRARARGMKVVELPVQWANHPDSKVQVWRDWPRVLRELWAIRRAARRNSHGDGPAA